MVSWNAVFVWGGIADFLKKEQHMNWEQTRGLPTSEYEDESEIKIDENGK